VIINREQTLVNLLLIYYKINFIITLTVKFSDVFYFHGLPQGDQISHLLLSIVGLTEAIIP